MLLINCVEFTWHQTILLFRDLFITLQPFFIELNLGTRKIYKALSHTLSIIFVGLSSIPFVCGIGTTYF